MRRIGIVNRGEAAVRFLTTLDAMRRESDDAPEAVALYTDGDADSLYVRQCERAVRIGEGRAAYLDAGVVVAALRRSGCDAAWLGWGFASEDAEYAQAIEDAGIILIGPRPETMEALGDKIAGKRLAEACEVPVAPWAIVEDGSDVAAVEAQANSVGFPLLVKAAGGGGGRGIRRVDRVGEVGEAWRSAREEAARSFRSHGILLERCVEHARHVEVQILGDGEGNVAVLGVRDCSLQRRRQKVIEECLAPELPETMRRHLEEAARRLGEAVRYRSAGTVEFLYEPDTGMACFLEVNTRLQVEHPVTEEVYGLDLVRAQIDLARGRPLPAIPPARGWALEARVCAEDVRNGFVPAPGRLVRYVLPAGPGVRVDTGFDEGDEISAEFDPLVAKVIAWGPSRSAAVARLSRALEGMRVVVDGGTTNLAFLRRLLQRDDVRAGRVDTALVDRIVLGKQAGEGVALLAAAVDRFLESGEDAAEGEDRHVVDVGERLQVYHVGPDTWRVVGEGGSVGFSYRADGPYQAWMELHGRRIRVERAPGDTTYVVDGVPHRVARDEGGAVSAPSAALVLDIAVRPGEEVSAGQRVGTVESMKMEVAVVAPVSGRVREVRVAGGDQVRAGQVLLVVEGEGQAERERVDIPWAELAPDPSNAAARLGAGVVGWDVEPRQFEIDVVRVPVEGALTLLETFADVAELFERRPTRLPESGAADAVTPTISFETLRHAGADALPEPRRAAIERALRHHGVESLEAGPALSDALRRLERAGLHLARASRAALAAMRALEQVPEALLERLRGLDPDRFRAIHDAVDHAGYELRASELPVQTDAELLEWLHATPDWTAASRLPTSRLRGLATAAVSGHVVAAQAVARLLAGSASASCQATWVGERTLWTVGRNGDAVLVAVASEAEASVTIEAIRGAQVNGRVDLVVPGVEDIDALVERLDIARAPWSELCVIGVGEALRVRRFRADGTEREERRDVLPTVERRFDLDRLRHFLLQPVVVEEDVFVFLATARRNPDDVRLMAYAEVHDVRTAEGRDGQRIPGLERVLRQSVRAIQTARNSADPRRRLHWNRLTLRVIPVVDRPYEEVEAYARKLAPLAARLGMEKVVVRLRLADPDGRATELLDLSIVDHAGHRTELVLRKASYKPLMPRTRYESSVAAARRRGLVHPYELVRMLSGGDTVAPGEFEEHDLDSRGRLRSVRGRSLGQNKASVVFGIMRTQLAAHADPVTRVLVMSDPTRDFGALAEGECARIIAAFELAERLGVPVEWVSVSAGARIDWDTGTENLDWTARVLRQIVQFTQRGGEVNVVVPGVCVGAQSYWNAEATMMMHTRGLLIMTDRGSMVLTGKRALDFSGCVSAADELEIGGYTSVMGPNGQAQAYAPDLGAGYRLLYRYYELTYAAAGRTPARVQTVDPVDRDVCQAPYPVELDHGFTTVGEIFSAEHNPDRKRPFAIRPLMTAVTDADVQPVERWAAMHGAETAVVWETRIGGHACTLVGIENRPVARLGTFGADGPDTLAGGTLFPQASRKVARALNAASGRRPVVVLANLSGFDGSPESLRHWQLEYGAEIGRAVVNFDGSIVFVVTSRYHGGAYVVFSKALNPGLRAAAIEGSFASVIGGAPAAAVVFARQTAQRAKELGGGPEAKAKATSELAARFDGIHTVERAREVGSIDDIIRPEALRPYVIGVLGEKSLRADGPSGVSLSRRNLDGELP